MPKEDKFALRTAGELRREIAAKGYTWSVDSRLRDSDQLPDHPRGGKLDDSVKPTITAADNLHDILRESPPANPFLRSRWVELKLLKPEKLVSTAGSPANVATLHHKEKKS